MERPDLAGYAAQSETSLGRRYPEAIRMIDRLMNATVIASSTVPPSGAWNIKLRFLLTMKGIITELA